jgi:small-conductance mechanosensitive channel
VSSDNYSGRIVEISNSFIFKNSVFNYSRDFPFLWDEIKIPIRYGSDLTLAQKLIRETADELLLEYATFAKATWDEMVRKYMIENAVVEPLIFIKADDNWVTFTLRFVIDYKKRGATKSQLFLSILQKIDQTDGKVQLASATFELTQLPPLKVDLKTP